MSFEFIFSGWSEARDLVLELGQIYTDATKEGMWEWGRGVGEEAQTLCPVDEGNLIGSWFIDDVVEAGDSLLLVFGFSAEYAIYQHEIMWYYHPKGGQAKYLEAPYIRRSGDLFETIAEYIRAAVEARA